MAVSWRKAKEIKRTGSETRLRRPGQRRPHIILANWLVQSDRLSRKGKKRETRDIISQKSDVAVQRQPQSHFNPDKMCFSAENKNKNKKKKNMRKRGNYCRKEYVVTGGSILFINQRRRDGEQVGISMNAFNAECDRARHQTRWKTATEWRYNFICSKRRKKKRPASCERDRATVVVYTHTHMKCERTIIIITVTPSFDGTHSPSKTGYQLEKL